MPVNIEEFISQIEQMTVLELNEVKNALQERFGVSAAMPMMAGGGGAPAGDGAAAPVEEEQTSFDVILTAAGDKKINVIKAVREVTTLGLKEAKDVVDSAPSPIKEGVTKEEAEQLKAKLEEQGATVEIR